MTSKDQHTKTLVILRGISGAGKSTLARSLMEKESDSVHLTTDDYFIHPFTKEYTFSPSKLPHAHLWNQQRAERAMRNGVKLVIVDNTHTQKWEAKPYVTDAIKYNYEVKFMEPDTEWKFDAETLARKNVHGVPLDKIRAMLQRYEHDFTVDNVLNAKVPNRARKVADRTPSMVQVALDKDSQNLLLSKVKKVHRDVFASHVTIAFKPTQEMYNSLVSGKDLLPQDKVTITTSTLVWSDSFKVESLIVDKMVADYKNTIVESDNQIPHITISVSKADGRQPVDSNELLKMHAEHQQDVHSEPCPLTLTGSIKFSFFGRRGPVSVADKTGAAQTNNSNRGNNRSRGRGGSRGASRGGRGGMRGDLRGRR